MESNQDSIQIPLLDQPIDKPKPAYFDTNIFDNYLFFWVNKIVDKTKKKTFSQEDHWNLRKSETSEDTTFNLSKTFEKVKNKKNPLLRALYHTNKG